MSEDICLYRYEVRSYAPPLDEFDNICGSSRRELVLMKLKVKHVTLKGFRLTHGRFVLKDARCRYACPTPEEAWESFQARKKAQIRILEAKINAAKEDASFKPEQANRSIY